MINEYWNMFEETGSVGAYLAYKALSGIEYEGGEGGLPYNAQEYMDERAYDGGGLF